MAKKRLGSILELVLFGLLLVVGVMLQKLTISLIFVGGCLVAYTYIKKSNNLDYKNANNKIGVMII